MQPLTSTEAIQILESLVPSGEIYCVGEDDEKIKKCLAVLYAIAAIKERDDMVESINSLLETVKSWKGE